MKRFSIPPREERERHSHTMSAYPKNFTRSWFAWQNTLFGELILKLVNEGKVDLLNSIQ